MPVHAEFWRQHPGLVWSNPEADDAVYIRAALLRGDYHVLLDIALAFGLPRLREEWRALAAEDSPALRRARPVTERILSNIEIGFEHAAA